ncbi:MAG: hypothetical protein AAF790_04445 [Planctomycetota bacterium]
MFYRFSTTRPGAEVSARPRDASLLWRPSRCATPPRSAGRGGLTLVEMLVAMALTLVLMGSVVSIFANVSGSVSNRRATIEMLTEVRSVRALLQRDLAGATCPGVPWQRPDSNHGYIEVIEGPRSDFAPSVWFQDADNDGVPDDVAGLQIDLTTSAVPSSNLGVLPGSNTIVSEAFNPTPNTALPGEPVPNAVTDGGGLGDADDALMLTVRNEQEPFVGRVPSGEVAGVANFFDWGSRTIESQLAEVVWFAVENPVEADDNRSFAFGEPGFRTVYRRTLLIAPQLDYGFQVGNRVTQRGVVRVLNGVARPQVDRALAALIAFQERYDLSVRLEWDEQLGGGRWLLIANSLADLTKRENRYEHHGYFLSGAAAAGVRRFPYAATSAGTGYTGNSANLAFVSDLQATPDAAGGEALVNTAGGSVVRYELDERGDYSPDTPAGSGVNGSYFGRPFVSVAVPLSAAAPAVAHATPRAIVNEDGQVAAITNGLVPLGGPRRGQDVVLNNALAFDLRVYDPKAPLLAEITNAASPDFPGDVYAPGDAGWGRLVQRDGAAAIVASRGAYVDLGYYRLHEAFFRSNDALTLGGSLFATTYNAATAAVVDTLVDDSVLAGRPSLKSQLRGAGVTLLDVYDAYRVYDTWSFHYEHNAIDEDNRDNDGNAFTGADESTNGFDDPDPGLGGDPRLLDNAADVAILGPDDAGERETAPPYEVRLRGVQATLRAYEFDSRQIREVKVSQTFVPK